VQSVWSACLTEPLKDLSFLWMLARSFEGSLALVDACQKYFSRISCSFECLPEEAFKDLSFLQCSWLFTEECSHLHARRTFQGSLSRSSGVLTRSSQGYHTCSDMVTCRDSQNAFVCKFDHPMYTTKMTSLTQPLARILEGKGGGRRDSSVRDQKRSDLQPEKTKMTEGRKYDKTSSIKSEQPAHDCSMLK
jgi:hypothetical protein